MLAPDTTTVHVYVNGMRVDTHFPLGSHYFPLGSHQDHVYANGAGTTIVTSDDGFRLVRTKS